MFDNKSIDCKPETAHSYIELYERQEGKNKDIQLIYKSIQIEPSKWAYFHLFYYYKKQKNFEKLIDSFLEMISFFERTNYKPTKEDNLVIDNYFSEKYIKFKNESNLYILYIKLYELQEEENKDIQLIYKSIQIKPSKWAYFHLFYYYKKQKNFEKLIDSFLEMISFFERTNYKPTKEDNLIINNYFAEEAINHPEKINYIKNNLIKIEEENLHIIPNHLECVVLLLTGDELETGYYEHFLNQIEKTLKNTNLYFSKKLDFKIITNKNQKIKTEILNNSFKSVEIIQSKIPEKYDFYLKEESEVKDHDLKYGLKSGPNYVFFESFEYLTQYNTTLFLECDCFFGEYWLEKIYNFTRFSSGFWISGSLYDGINSQGKHANINEHINGGIALYATGNYLFLNFLKSVWKSFPFFVSQESDLPYDYCIKQFIDDYYSLGPQKELMNFINRQYLFNNLIFNYSTEQEHDIEEYSIRKKYSYAILHKKLSKNEKTNEIHEIKVDKDFDANFYYDRYPAVKEYYLEYCKQNNIPDDVRAYHHYLNYGVYLGLLKNNKQVECDKSILRNYTSE